MLTAEEKRIYDRCEWCKYVDAGCADGWVFHCCTKKKNKWIVEIKDCDEFEKADERFKVCLKKKWEKNR